MKYFFLHRNYFVAVLLSLGIVVAAFNIGYGQSKENEDALRSVDFHVDSSMSVLDSGHLQYMKQLPYTYVGQFLDGQAPGVNLIRTSGEPGVAPLTLLQGISIPIGDYKDVYANRPLIIIDGIPLIRNDDPYQLSIKAYPFTGVGSGIDISSLIDVNNIQSIKIEKGAEAVALFGVHAANGAIVINTRPPRAGKYRIGLNLYSGIALPPSLNTKNGMNLINGDYEKNFLMPFYEKYATDAEKLNFPAYLSDSTSSAYFGPSDWNKSYYRLAFEHGAGINITGGSERAKFRFGIGEHTENGVADKTSLKRYNVYYNMFIVPIKKLGIQVFVRAATANRDRNHSLRERFGNMAYFPSQDYPLPPNNTFLKPYYSFLNEGIDQNIVNSIQGLTKFEYQLLKNLSVSSKFSADYNDNHRNLFVPGALNDGNSFNSYYSGVNRRILWDNSLLFKKAFSGRSGLHIKLGQSIEYDRMQYGYTKGYRGPSDFIKIIEVDNVDNTWLTHNKNLVYAYKDYLKQNMVSFYGSVSYDFHDKYSATFNLRSDGSSYFGNGYFWSVSPTLSVRWDLIKESWMKTSQIFKKMTLIGNLGRTARSPLDDYYGYGPYYTEDIGWEGSENVSTYASFPTLSPPFTNGFVNGDIQWPYSDHLGLGLDVSVLHNLRLSARAYSRTDKNLLVSIPTGGAAYGFSGQWLNGMQIRNSGFEVSMNKTSVISSSLQWVSTLNFQFNKNKLISLPNGIKKLNDGQHELEVGKSVDQFWLLKNNGIYDSESDIPVVNGNKLSYNGIPFQAGDPRWEDVNKDGVINDDDRVMMGHIIAPVHGGWNNYFTFKNWTLGFSFLYSLGNDILNEAVANRFDFANREGVSALNGVKELTFWQVKGDLSKYPKYNPWSLVDPYQTEQTLFYEKGDLVRLRSVLLQYDLTSLPFIKKAKIERLQIYITGSNLFNFTSYGGANPALVDYFGYDYGQREPLPMTFTFGIRGNF